MRRDVSNTEGSARVAVDTINGFILVDVGTTEGDQVVDMWA